MSDLTPIARDLFTGPSASPSLVGARCPDCACVTFPAQKACPRCTGTAMAPLALPRTGTLWSWTIQDFPPKSPPYRPAGAFAPYGVGYIDLGPVIVEARLTEHRPERLRIGMPMVTVALPWHDRVAFAFAPVEGDR